MGTQTQDGWGGYFQADALYWLPHEAGLEYAYRQESPEDSFSEMNLELVSTTENGQFKRVDFEWMPGVRLESGFHFPLDHWSTYAKWTRIAGNMSGSTHIDSIETANIAPIWLGAGYHFSGEERVLSASGRWNLHYNTVSLALKKEYFSSPRLLIGAHAGLQGAWINQQFRANYSGGTLTTGPTFFKGKNNFQAAGIFSEFDMQWFMSKHWKLLSRVQGSLNFGKYRLSQRVMSEINDGSVVLTNSLHNAMQQNLYRTRFAYEAGLGVEFEWAFKKTILAVRTMYDLVEWMHLNQLKRFTYSDSRSNRYFFSTNGNLGFQGVSLAVRLDY